MRYSSGQIMKVGDEVIADGMTGFIVCDFDNREYADGYSNFDPPSGQSLGDSVPSSGIMINTVEAGLIHYKPDRGDIRLVRSSAI